MDLSWFSDCGKGFVLLMANETASSGSSAANTPNRSFSIKDGAKAVEASPVLTVV
jgi:hypothetical protein